MILMRRSEREVDQANNVKLAPVDLRFLLHWVNVWLFTLSLIKYPHFQLNEDLFFTSDLHLSMETFESGKAAANINSLFVREVVHCKKLSANVNMLRLAASPCFMSNVNAI